jgi:hypothetical protein
MPDEMTLREFTSMGGRARAQALTPERRHGIASLGYLARCVTEIERRYPELTEEQRQRLASLLRPPEDQL